MKQIKRYDVEDEGIFNNNEGGNWCRYEDVQSLEKENEELKKYKEAWERIKCCGDESNDVPASLFLYEIIDKIEKEIGR